MDVIVDRREDVTILSVKGHLSLGADVVLRDQVLELLKTDAQLFVFDLSQVPYIDSVGLGETVACTKRICERGGAVRLVVEKHGKVHEILRITGLDRAYEVFSDKQAALVGWPARPQQR